MEAPGSITLVTADAGVGKSAYLLAKYPKSTSVFLAPTGVAAARLGTQTLHSLLHLGVEKPRPPAASAAAMSEDAVRSVATATTIVIDEAYYCPAAVAAAADAVLRVLMRRDEPFGGKDLVLAGDPWQLALGDATAVTYVEDLGLVPQRLVIPHHSAMRCTATHLNAARILQSPTICEATIRDFAARGRPAPIHGAPWLTFTNADRAAINGAAPVPGDPIMLLVNADIAAGFFNGTRGRLVVRRGRPHIEIAGPKFCPLPTGSYEKCLAMTIHKAQGATLEAANIYLNLDRVLGNPEVNRLLYVALTRVRDENAYFLTFAAPAQP